MNKQISTDHMVRLKSGPYIFWIIFSLILALTASILTYFYAANGESILFLLSAISQSLAAIFALIFTITIFAAQTMGNFTAIDKILDKWTKGLMILFSIGIILPLIQLSTNINLPNLESYKIANFGLAIVVGIATVCVFAIIPFLIKVNLIMKYEVGLSKVREDLSNIVFEDKHNIIIISNRINDLADLGISSIKDKMHWAFNDILKEFEKLYLCNHTQSLAWNGMKKILKKYNEEMAEIWKFYFFLNTTMLSDKIDKYLEFLDKFDKDSIHKTHFCEKEMEWEREWERELEIKAWKEKLIK